MENLINLLIISQIRVYMHQDSYSVMQLRSSLALIQILLKLELHQNMTLI